MHPVFHWELIRTSRRPGIWIYRAVYGGILLLCLFASFASVQSRPRNRYDDAYRLRPLAVMGGEFYAWFRGAQFLLVVCTAPMFAARSMNEEVRAGSLPLLLCSSLGPAGVVVSKGALSLLRVLELLLVGLPFASLVVLMGGVSYQQLLIDFLLTFTAAFSAVGMGILAGSLAANSATAVQSVVATQLLWYSAPILLTMLPISSRAIAGWGWILIRPNLLCSLIPRYNVVGAAAAADPTTACAVGLAIGLGCLALVVHRLARTRGCTAPQSPKRARNDASQAARKMGVVWDRSALWRELRRRPLRRFEKILCLLYLAVVLATLAGSLASWSASRDQISRRLWSHDAPSLFLVEVIAALLLGFVAFPGQALAGAHAFADEREKNLLDVWKLTSTTHCELVHAKLARLLIRGAYLVLAPASLGIPCVLLGWTTWMGLALAWLLWCSAGLAATMLGLALGIHASKPEHAALAAAAATMLIGALIPTAIFLGGPTRTTTLYRSTTPTSPAMHGTFLLAVDFQAPEEVYRTRRNFVGEQFSRREFRVWAAIWGAAYLLAAAGLYAWALAPPGGR